MNLRYLSYAWIALSPIAWSPYSLAADYCVSNSDDFQNALVAARYNFQDDSIRMQAGLYQRSSSSIGFSGLIEDGQSLDISGGWRSTCAVQDTDPRLTIIDGQDSRRALRIDVSGSSPSTTHISIGTITIRNGHVTGKEYGGALRINGPGSLTVADSVIHSNFSGEYGGAIAGWTRHGITLLRNRLERNTTSRYWGTAVLVCQSEIDCTIAVESNVLRMESSELDFLIEQRSVDTNPSILRFVNNTISFKSPPIMYLISLRTGSSDFDDVVIGGNVLLGPIDGKWPGIYVQLDSNGNSLVPIARIENNWLGHPSAIQTFPDQSIGSSNVVSSFIANVDPATLRPTSQSVLIDAMPDGWSFLGPLDVDRGNRMVGARSDAGAAEFQDLIVRSSFE